MLIWLISRSQWKKKKKSTLQLQLCFVLLIFQFHPSLSQQQYRGNKALNCNSSEDQYRGYTCNGPQKSCQSYLTFRSHPPYDSPLSIADLMASEASSIASTNKAPSESYTFPPETLVTVPVSCSCWGNTYFHNAPYTIQMNQSYFMIANETYQGLTACQTVAGTNDYFINGGGTLGGTFLAGSMIMVPVTCACPSYEQAKNKVSSLLVYMIVWGDTLYTIGKRFGVSLDSLFKANNLTENDVIFPFSPLLVPLQDTSCSENQRSFLCKPSPPTPSAKLVTILGICIGIGFVCLFFICYFLYQHIKKRRHIIKKQNLFIRNGGLLLQKRLASSRSTDNLKLFTAEELERATDNYSKSRFLGQGGYGNVYKGMLLDGTIVAVKRSKTMDKTRIKQFINEVAILSQINHRNVVKLIGSCLETELPLLVYEFIPKGSLFDHIHVSESGSEYLSWSLRFRIACEVAGAVAYMHSAASIPIFHRDIKSSNILLDEKYSAKVSDFGTSRSVPVDKTHLTTGVQGTFGYLDPEYVRSGQFTDKSDVYSFGVVLVELLTGEKPISGNENGNVVSRFVSLVKEEKVEGILDPRIAREVSQREVVVIGKIVKRCLRLNGKMRPSMKEVEIELENLVKSQACLDVCKDHEGLSGEGDSEDEDEDFEMKLGFVDESLAYVSLNMDSIYPRD